MEMARPMPDFVSCYRFSVQTNKKSIPMAFVGDIEVDEVKGQPRFKPVEMRCAHKVGEKTMVEMLGGRPFSKVNILLQELSRGGVGTGEPKVVRNILLRECKVKGYKIGPHDAMADGVVLETIKVHPKSVRVATVVEGMLVSAGSVTE